MILSSGLKAPDKGSFPLDHFKECDKFIVSYHKCLRENENIPKKCRENQKNYLLCRMDNGLMKREAIEKLGFTEEMSWEYEQKMKESAVADIRRREEEARRRIEEKMKSKRFRE